MTLSAVESRSKIALAADWCELFAIHSSRKVCSYADLKKSIENLEEDWESPEILEPSENNGLEYEDLDEKILDEPNEEWVGDVRAELDYRRRSLDGNYPFTLEGSERWILTSSHDPDYISHLVYRSMLFATGMRFGLLTPIPDIDRAVQIASTLVAGRIVDGEAVWFGWPRPDGTKFQSAMESWLERLGEKIPLTPPSWTTGAEKDEGIDIIAWRSFGDAIAPRLILFGQVASGRNNWENKSVKAYLDARIDSWLGEYMQKSVIPAMFVPWPQYIEVDAKTRNRTAPEKKDFRAWCASEARLREKTLGLLIDRVRAAELAESVEEELSKELIESLSQWTQAALKAQA